jgi:UDP-N-acetylmuramate: L-alanyl-gamma-D-glutamyl-meso-diaminopimelate ligase
LFLEDLNEDVYRFLRSIDAMRLNGFFSQTQAIVLGSFSNCPFNNGKPSSENEIAELVSQKLRLPVYVLPVFGHDRWRLPLVFGARVRLSLDEVLISFDAARPDLAVSSFKAASFLPTSSSGSSTKPRVHFTGIGGTGMAAVAGLFAASGFSISGSDGPIYPPMDKTLRDIGVKPLVGYAAENIIQSRPDAVVLANVVSRRNAELKPNLEFEALLRDSVPLFSFPSALRHFFLHEARNVVVSGTHGKTTTTSFLAHLLTGLGENPSFVVGGTPKNFGIGFALRNPTLFVLEGDEYDSALFDKGPKFLHYEPTVAILNNIEFDHADIYADVEAIEKEFERLVSLCMARGGIVVANAGDARVRRIAQAYANRVLWFGTESDVAQLVRPAAWTLVSLQPTRSGMIVTLRAPWGEQLTCPMGLFGTHNALNAMAAIASLQALHLHADYSLRTGISAASQKAFEERARINDSSFPLAKALAACGTFEGVKRRFELVGLHADIRVYDDFAHHPTAIDTTLAAFKAYLSAAGVQGRLVACFDPRNATMRRRVLQNALAASFSHADLVFLGKVAVDKRLAEDETLDGLAVQRSIGEKARYFEDNEEMCSVLKATLRPGDTIVFMSSGSFDGLPQKLFERLAHS